jgi:alkylation response protein AidB-like acyl-CoA dehydrogenase
MGPTSVDHRVIRAARDLGPLLALHRFQRGDQAGFAPEVVEAAGVAGLFRLCAPREVGGVEAPPHVAAAAVMEIAAEDPAVAWGVVNSMPACLAAAWLDRSACEALFAERDRNFGFSATPAGRAKPIAGGYWLSGEWPLVTGVETAAWCGLTAPVLEGDGSRLLGGTPDERLFLVPVGDVEIVRSRVDDVAMRSASQPVRVHDAFVPEEFATTSRKPLRIDRPLYRIPYRSTLAAVNAAICVGVLAGAVDAASVDATNRQPTLDRDKPTGAVVVDALSRADAASRSLSAGVVEVASMLWTAAACDGRPNKQLRAMVQAMMFYAADVARETIGSLHRRSSPACVRRHPVEQALYDIQAISCRFEPPEGVRARRRRGPHCSHSGQPI